MTDLPPDAPAEHTFVAPDGTTRASHYGPPGTVQPWDTVVKMGWGPQFAAANVIKYMRRSKEPEDARKKAIWYWRELCRMAVFRDDDSDYVEASLVLVKLMYELTNDELAILRACT
jgi:hypothetical protein